MKKKRFQVSHEAKDSKLGKTAKGERRRNRRRRPFQPFTTKEKVLGGTQNEGKKGRRCQ